MIIPESNRLRTVETYYFATKLAEIRQRNMQGEDIINLGIGSPDLPPPTEVISHFKSIIHQEGMHSYQSYRGLPELRDAFGKWYKNHFDVEIDASQEVLPLLGSKEGVMHISMSFLNIGDQVLVPNPGYPAYRAAAKLAGADVIEYHLLEKNNWYPDFEALEKMDLSKVKILWMNYPGMPTGSKGNIKMFQKMIDFAKRHQILICHDNPYGFILNDSNHSLFQIEGAKDVAIELFSMSKMYNMAGWRIGAVLGKSTYINTILKFKSNMDSGMFKPTQLAAIKALDADKKWMEELNSIYKKRREKAFEILDILGCKYSNNSSGLFVWARIPDSVPHTEKWINEIMDKTKVFLTPGFIFGSNGERYIRISLCSNENLLDESIQRIKLFNPNQKIESSCR